MLIDVKTTLATLKTAATVAREAGKIDLYQQILDLQQTVLDAIAQNTELAQANAELTREVNRLRDEIDAAQRAAKQRASYVFRDNAYWIEAQGDAPSDGPFCPKCLDADGKAIRMTDRGNGFTCCVHCRHCIDTPGYVPPPRQPRMGPGTGWVNGWRR